jgi:hypothetical protein
VKSLKKLKDDLDRKHRVLVREQARKKDLTSKLVDSDASYSEKTKLQNDLIAAKANIRSLYAEVSELSDEIFGDWKPKNKKGFTR